MNRPSRRAALGAAAAFTIAPSTRAQVFPAKPMRFLVPYPVGGIVDIVTRCLPIPCRSISASRSSSSPSPAAIPPWPPP